MPNYVYNTIICKENLLNKILNAENLVDFGILIPEPKTKKDCIDMYGNAYIDEPNEKGESSRRLMHDDGKDWFNWYDWHCDFWGCKWNACETNVEKENEYYYITFMTAWCEPDYWIDKLAKLNKPFIFHWEEERRYGQLVGYNGKIDIEKVWNKNEKQVDLSNENILNKFFGE